MRCIVHVLISCNTTGGVDLQTTVPRWVGGGGVKIISKACTVRFPGVQPRKHHKETPQGNTPRKHPKETPQGNAPRKHHKEHPKETPQGNASRKRP